MKTLAIAAVRLSKREATSTTHTMTMHYRTDVNENEMRGIAVEAAFKAKPGFSVDDVLISTVEIGELFIKAPTI